MWPVLVFDTETSTLPDFKLPADHPNQAQIVSIAAALIHEDATKDRLMERIVKPNGWTIAFDAARIHGITTEMALEKGSPLADVIAEFDDLEKEAATLASFGIQFDTKFLRGARRICGRPDGFGSKPELCVMKACVDLCKIPPTEKMLASGRNWFKTPNLTEAAKILLGIEHIKAHSAGGDVEVTVKLLRYLAERGLAKPAVRESKPQRPKAPTPAASATTEAF